MRSVQELVEMSFSDERVSLDGYAGRLVSIAIPELEVVDGLVISDPVDLPDGHAQVTLPDGRHAVHVGGIRWDTGEANPYIGTAVVGAPEQVVRWESDYAEVEIDRGVACFVSGSKAHAASSVLIYDDDEYDRAVEELIVRGAAYPTPLGRSCLLVNSSVGAGVFSIHVGLGRDGSVVAVLTDLEGFHSAVLT